tara:strand:+ start:790 stop:3882 length:3093 start_codon:yes stop_codon:yes gene_type:complete
MDNNNHHTKKYIDFHEKYKEKYGENTIVLMQTGSHFNIFAVINDEVNLGPDIYHICQNVLNNSLLVTKQNKKVPEISIKNCLLAGFPLCAIQKYETILLNNNYTVVVVEQITPPPNPERGVTRIVSPGTSIENYNKQDNHYLMSIYIEKNQYMMKDSYITGLSVIDLSTGNNYLHYIISKLENNHSWIDEIGRYIHFYNPSEILFHLKGFILSQDDIIQQWDIYHNSIQINHYNDKTLLKTDYQNEFLNKIFTLNCIMSPIEHFDLEMKSELVISYIYLLKYIQDHRADTLNNIEKPEVISDNKCLCITSNSIRQLNVINNYSYYKGKNESLLSVCNLCVTPMGKRLFKERLLYPLIDTELINQRYDFIDLFRKDDFYKTIHLNLKKVSDLEKSLRKMGLKLLEPSEFFSDSLSFEYINKLLDTLENERNIIQKYGIEKTKLIDSFKNFYNEVNNTFIFHNLSQSGNLEKSILQKGIYTELDNYDNLNDEYHTRLMYIGKRLSSLLDNSENSIKLDYDEKNGWYFFCTNKRALTFKERLTNLNGNEFHVRNGENKIIYSFKREQFGFRKKDSSSTIISFETCNEISKKLITIQDKIKNLNKKQWDINIEIIFKKYSRNLKQFYLFLSEIDVFCAGAKCSIQNGYSRPTIVQKEKGFLDVKDIRHPIVEKIHTDTEYITNDIELGTVKDGILLFGTNACGKSTFMKAVGLNIIMAQAGLFVAASSFHYKPYTQIFTRILNNDNIFRSQSSFAVEIQELKSILNCSDKNSLILGDELCSGTESISALSIICSGLDILCKRGSSFIFTSHLHELTKLSEVKELKNLEIYHLKIQYDKEKDILIYDRKLEKGSGPSIYGLKVCEAMGLSNEFISFAKKIQNKLEKVDDSQKISQYNTNVFMDECKICSSKEELETHHIKDQQYADKNNMIGGHHKNIKHNLVPLCKKCHLKVTNKEIIVDGWTETTKGRQLNWYTSDKKNSSKKKFNDTEVKNIIQLRNQYNSLSQKDFIKQIEIKQNIKISSSTLKKIIDNIY